LAEADPIKTLYPLSDFVDPVDVLLGEYLSLGDVDLCKGILVADARCEVGPHGIVLEADFFLGGLPALHLPGIDLVDLKIEDEDPAHAVLICSEQPSLTVDEIGITISFDPSILGNGQVRGEITAKCGFALDSDGFRLTRCTGANLAKCHVAGTEATLEVMGIKLASTGDDWLVADTATLELPMFSDGAGLPLTLTGTGLAIGRHGPSGRFDRTSDAPIQCTVFGFDCEIDEASLKLDHGALCDVVISGSIDISRFAPDESDGVVDVHFSFGTHGISATLSNPDAILSLQAAGVFSLNVTTLRLEEGVLWISGDLTPEIDGVNGDWPAFSFDEIGITPTGEIRLAAGASLATDQPFSVDWGLATLTVTSFSLERPEDAPGDIELRLSAGIELLKGLPAGASVDGLVARWYRDAPPSIRFDGIGLHYGTPGAFDVAVTVAWNEEDGEFSGSGHVDISSIDMRLDVVFAMRRARGGFNTMFLAAETSIPGGIPIAASGLSIYGVSGLLAHNMEIKAPADAPDRYFDAFIGGSKPGFAVIEKWQAAEHSEALGLGVLVGSGDDGWTFSARGGLILSLPDLSILVTATADLLAERKAMTNPEPSKLSAVLAIHPALQQLRLDFAFEWDADPLFSVAGEGGGEFNFGRPQDGLIWAGKSPETGSPITANYFRFTGDWLFKAGYWLSIGLAQGVETGVIAKIELREGSSSVYAGIDGRLLGQLKLCFAPFQLEGRLELAAHGELKGGGIGIDIGVYAGFKLTIDHPQRLEVPLEACISIDIGIDTIDFCLGYTFLWERIDPPELEGLIHGVSFLPRDWVPIATDALDASADEAAAGLPPGPAVKTGIVQLAPIADVDFHDLGEVHPHSVIALEFAKSMTFAAASQHLDFGTPAVPYPKPIGSVSGFSERWSLTELSLVDLDDNREVDLFGAFSLSAGAREVAGRTLSPRPVNTELRLFTSRRFGQSGSLGGGGAEETPAPDCHPKDEYAHVCSDLAGTLPGYGRLDRGWRYLWAARERVGRAFRGGVALAGDDYFILDVPEGYAEIELTFTTYERGPIPAQPWPMQTETMQVPADRRVLLPRGRLYTKVCWLDLVAQEGTQGPRVGESATGKQEWDVDDDSRTLTPGHTYELKLTVVGAVLNPGGGQARAGQATRRYRFTAGRAPAWSDALSRAVAAVNPADGRRPVFRHYDLMARFGEDVWAGLYRRDRRQLGIRLIDSDGHPVEVAAGRTVAVPPNWRKAPAKIPPVEKWWRDARSKDPGNACAAMPPPPDAADTVLPVQLDQLTLRAHARYRADIVAMDDTRDEATLTPPLMSWSFTTSGYGTFTDLATMPAEVPSLGLAQLAAPAGTDFEALALSFGVPAVASVEAVRMTPLAAVDGVTHLLIESPEPLRDREDRLTIEIAGKPVLFVGNRDSTRLIATLAATIPVNGLQDVLTVKLEWRGAPANAPIEEQLMIAGVPVSETCSWQVPLGALA